VKEFPFIAAVVGVFVHATEDREKVLRAVRAILPKNAKIDVSDLRGHHGNPISLLESRITKRAALREWWPEFAEKLGKAGVQKILQELPAKTDDSCKLYLRFDKQCAFAGELFLTDGEDIVHLTLKVAAYPAKREAAIESVRKFLSEWSST
jgi:hypothetical protein